MPHPRQQPTTVLVVDAYTPAREALAHALTSFGIGPITQAATATDARLLAPPAGDLALIDLALPDGSGPDLITELRALGWARVVALSNSNDPALACAAIAAGAHAYLTNATTPGPATTTRPTGPTTRPTTGPTAGPAAGPTAAPPHSATAPHANDATPRGLSAREIEVLQLVADGRSNKEIGDTLHLSSLTVKSHLSRIGRKLGTGDRAHLVALTMRAGLVR